jgi:hypothetical protein
MNVTHVGPAGLIVFEWDANPDLIVGAISTRPFGPRILGHRFNLAAQF